SAAPSAPLGSGASRLEEQRGRLLAHFQRRRSRRGAQPRRNRGGAQRSGAQPRRSRGGTRAASAALPEKLLDRLQDRVPILDLRKHQVVRLHVPLQRVQELTAAVPALDLAVAEQVAHRQQAFAQQREALLVVAAAPVVAVREVEHVDVPLLRRVVPLDDLGRELVRARDARAAGLARRVERLPVDLTGRRVVDDVARLEAVVVRADPGVDPERLDAHDLLLLVPHRAGHVHHVQDHRVRDRLRLNLPGAVAHVVADRDDDRAHGAVRARGDLPAQRLLVRALERAQALRPGALDAAVAVARDGQRLCALWLDARQLELPDVVPRRVAGLARAVRVAVRAQRRARLALALADAAQVTAAVAEVRQLDLRQRDRDQLLAPPPDQLASGEMPLEVLLDLAADDVLEPPAIALDTPDHTASTTAPAPSSTPAMVVMPAPARVTGRGRGGALAPASARRPRVAAPGRYARPSLTSPRAKMLATKFSTSVAHTSQ